jgi:PAS domain S-box-containing protein
MAKTEFDSHILNKIVVPQTIFGRYLFASAIFAFAFAIRWFFFFYPAVVFAAFLCGTGAGLQVTVLSLLAVSYFYIPPFGSFVIHEGSWPALASFTALGIFISLLIGRMQRGALSATALNRQLAGTMAALEQDIAERKQVEEALLNTEKRLNLSIESGEIGLWELDLVNHTTWRSPLHDKTFGYETLLPEWTYEMLMAHVITEDRAEVNQKFGDSIANLTSWNFECRIKRKDGAVRWVWVKGTHELDEHNKPLKMIGVVQDITERKLHELNSKQFEAIVQSSDDAIMSKSLDGAVLSWNPGAEVMFGYSTEEMIGTHMVVILPPDRLNQEEGILNRLLNDKKFIQFEAVGLHKDGTKIDVSVTISRIHDQDGKVIGTTKIVHNITERKQFQYALLEKNVELEGATVLAEKANLAKSEFLSSMSHELRTPLNVVLGFAQLLDCGMPSLPQKLSIDQILKAGWHLLDLVNEILDLAMIESGKVSMSIEPISLSAVLQDYQAMIAPQAQKRGVVMIFPEFAYPCYVRADMTRLKQVMINLLSNAIKYNLDDGSIIVQWAMVEDNRVRISITDTGHGMTPEQLAQLFQPFNRLGREDGSEEGTGIGLVVTKQLVELMGGTIGVESGVGVGSVFWIELEAAHAQELPIHEVTQSKKGEPVQVEALSTQRTLLYIEDEPANFLLVKQLIVRHSNLKLLSAINAFRGIEMACTMQPDLILMDINLPYISGFDALKLLRENPVTAHITVIALSANAMARDIQKGLEAGFFSYLTKPIKIDEFMNALDAALLHVAENDLKSEGADDDIGVVPAVTFVAH